MVHQHTYITVQEPLTERLIKITDFGRSRLCGSVIDKNEEAYGVMPYMDPKILNDHSYDLMIYIAVLFWQLTSYKTPSNLKQIIVWKAAL